MTIFGAPYTTFWCLAGWDSSIYSANGLLTPLNFDPKSHDC